MEVAEAEAVRVSKLSDGGGNRMVSVFSPSSVRIERIGLAVQYGHPEDVLKPAKGMRLSQDTPPSWRTWPLLDVSRAHADIGDAAGAVKTLESLRRVAPTWMQHHALAGVPPTHRAPEGEHGRGLLLVATLAESWDTEPLPWGKRVWAELHGRARG